VIVGRLPIAASTSTTAIVDGRELIVFAGCDYLGLAHHPRVIAAMEKGVREFGLSASASRETSGNTVAHDELERDLARFFGVEVALLTPDGYLSNLIAAQGLPVAITTVMVDAESHVSVRDALAATGRRTRDYALADAAAAGRLARELRGSPFAIVTDGIFPVLCKLAPLRELLELLPPDGLLIVDDSHGVGVLGERGRGSVELAGLADPRIVITGTLSKALGCFGGFVVGSREVVEPMRRRSHAYVGSTPIPPAIARAAIEALRLVDEEPERRVRLLENARPFRKQFASLGFPIPTVPYPVLKLDFKTVQENESAERAFIEDGLLVPRVHYPDGLEDYFRIALRADHTLRQLQTLMSTLRTKILR
jgi:8-amino-7-oxononanoate synthase